MNMKEFCERLKERGERFLVDAELDFESKEYDVALFHVEQAVQLFLKAKIVSFGVEFPKVHEISKLLKILKELGVKGVEELTKNRKVVELLEFSYVSSRYLPVSFSKEDVKEAIEFAKRLKEILWKK